MDKLTASVDPLVHAVPYRLFLDHWHYAAHALMSCSLAVLPLCISLAHHYVALLLHHELQPQSVKKQTQQITPYYEQVL